MAQLTERELRDKQRGLESLNARDAKDMDLQRKQMNIWRDDTRPSAIQRYNTAKAKLDELNAAVNTRIGEIESIKSQLSDIADNKESEKTTQDIKTKNKQLKIAEENLETTKAEQLRAEIKALEDKAKVSLTGGSTGNEQYDGDNDFVRDVNAKGLSVTVDPNNGNSWVSGAEGDSQVQQYIYISEESRPTEIVGGKLRRSGSSSKPYTPSTSDFDAIRKRIIEEAISSPRGLKGLFDDLRGAGLRIPNNDYNRLDTTSVSFGQALSNALQRHTKAMVNDLEINKNTNPKSFFQYVREDLKDSGIGDPEVDYNEYVTKRDEADSDLNRFFMDYLGRNASDEELNKYYKELRALEKKNAQVTTTTKNTDSGGTSKVTTGEYQLDTEDILQLQRKIAGKALDGSDIDVVLKGGSKAAQDVNSTLAYAKRYGVTLTNKDALNYVANSYKNNDKDTSKINAKILAISKATYSNLADVLSEDVSLNDLSANYKYTMRQVLEIPESQVDTLNPTIQLALKNNGNKGAMNLTDFERVLKQDPRWGYTSNAMETAAGYANSILRNFGLIA
jgi:hypothetical protein